MIYRDSVISLFSGAGGFSLGFAQAGLKPIVAADIDADACCTYQDNLGGEALNVDLSDTSSAFHKFIAGVREPLAIIGGPPCQGFSSAGAKDGKDTRNKLIFNYLSIVEKTRPRWFLFENVEGLLTSNNGKSVADLIREFVAIGYRVRLEKVNFAAFGLPQARKRVVLLGNRLGLAFALPSSTHSYDAGKHKSLSSLPLSPTLGEALAGLGGIVAHFDGHSPYATSRPLTDYDAMMRYGNDATSVTLHVSTTSDALHALLSRLLPGQTMKDLPDEFWHSSFRRRAFRRVMDGTATEKRGGAPSGIKRLYRDRNALTITSAAPREFIHPDEDRPLTLRESARLQSFPDAYQFTGTSMSIARQIGNAFPPLAARVFAEHIIRLDGSHGADKHIPTDTKGALIGYHLTDAIGMSPALVRASMLLERMMTGQDTLPLEACDVKEVE